MSIEELRGKIIRRAEILSEGMSESQLKRNLQSGALVRMHPGRYVSRETWDAGHQERRHILRVLAADDARRNGDVVFAFASAAVLWDLPLFRHPDGPVHVSGPRTDAVVRPKAGLAHHGVSVDPEDRTMLSAVPCTSLSRTVFDMIRTTSRETAVALADAALRRVAAADGGRVYDHEAAERFRSEVLGRIDGAAGARGIRQARWVMRFADGRAELPGESVSRLYLVDLGFAVPRVQVPFTGPRGEAWRIDLAMDDVHAWGEFDGTGKYTDPSMLHGRTLEQVLFNEKQREDWIRGRSQWKFARWGTPHVRSAATLGARLAHFSIVPPG
jgi:hypothetical protein